MSDSCVAQTMVPRVGRDHQRYGTQKERLVAGVVALSQDLSKVLLVTKSTDRSKWVLPKGGWEDDEGAFQAACREAWEEAGLVCTHLRDLPTILDKRPAKPGKAKSKGGLVVSGSEPDAADGADPEAPKATYHFFDVVVTSVEPEWPEMGKRSRRWATYSEATALLAGREELLTALNLSSIRRNS